MIQPLHQQLVSEFQTTGRDTGKVVFTFPPVPQGSVWTGTISVSSPQGSDPQGLVWTLLRNGTPFLSGNEWPAFVDVQAVGREVMELVGVYIGANSVPSYQMAASWTGYAADASEAPSLGPTIQNSTRGLVQVYNTQGAGGPLEVIPWPLPSSVLTDLTILTGTGGDSGPLLAALTADKFYSLWELTLQVTMAQDSATAGAQSVTVTIAESGGGSTLLHTVTYAEPGAAVAVPYRQQFYGLNLPAGTNLEVTMGVSGATDITAVAHAIATALPA